MIKYICLFLMFSSLCFCKSQDAIDKLANITVISMDNRWNECVRLLTSWIEDPSISSTDKVHYLWYRKNIHMIAHDIDAYVQDMNRLDNLCRLDANCLAESKKFYGFPL